MRIITIFPAILVHGTWFSTSTQAVPLTDLDAKNLLLPRKNLPKEDTKSAHAQEEAILRAVHDHSQRIERALAVAEQLLSVRLAFGGLPEADPHVLIMRRNTYCLEHAAESVQASLGAEIQRLGCLRLHILQELANCCERAMTAGGDGCPAPPINELYEGYRIPDDVHT